MPAEHLIEPDDDLGAPYDSALEGLIESVSNLGARPMTPRWRIIVVTLFAVVLGAFILASVWFPGKW